MKNFVRNWLLLFVGVAAIMVLTGCRTTRHVPQGEYLLDKITISVVDSSNVVGKKYRNYVRQQPNHKVLGLFRMQLGIYNWSKPGSNSGFNRWLRKVGEAPVVFDSVLMEQSVRQLQLALENNGFRDAKVEAEAIVRKNPKKIEVKYNLYPGQPHVISSIAYEIEEPGLREIVLADSTSLPVQVGSHLDLNILDNQRTLIADRMRNHGYFAFSKEYVTFIADTLPGSKEVELTMVLKSPTKSTGDDFINKPSDTAKFNHERYAYRRVIIVPDFSPGDNLGDFNFHATDTVNYKGLEILYSDDRYLSPKALAEQCYIRPGDFYSVTGIDRTYEGFNRLGILRYVNIATRPVGRVGDVEMLDVYILLSRTKKMGVTVSLEGTNSEGDLGVGGGITYQHRNLAHGGETLTAKVRGSYESLTGNFEGLINKSYNELAAEVGISFPQFMAPFLKRSFKQRVRASTEFAVTFMRQDRPEYTRIMSGAAWRYKWADRNNQTRRNFDFIDINVVSLPRSTLDFLDNIAPGNPLLRYSYEDHFIMRMGYTWSHTNRRPATSSFERLAPQVNVYTARLSAETAGALLYAISEITHMKKSDGAYKIFGIQYAQYLKGEADYTINHRFTAKNSLSFHAGFGIAFPYGNSSMVPFEKRFYAGGANGVRGWGVRTLGPGSYDSRNSVTDFINQCGDISMIVNLEYRNKLFWVLEGALFIDAGNIWTIRDYPNQPGGVFRFNSFYKEIAAAYGIGLRLDFEYFLLRFDLGMKAHNPASGQEPWPLIHPNWKRDSSFHFSVGYPF